jgi:ribosomal protein S18 acetylase RimI-like enzyme
LRYAASCKQLQLQEQTGRNLSEGAMAEALALVHANMGHFPDWEEGSRLADLSHANTRLLLLRSAPQHPAADGAPASIVAPAPSAGRRSRSRSGGDAAAEGVAVRGAADGSRLVAFASFRLVTQETLPVVYLLELQLEGALRRQGLGSELLAAVLRFGQAKGCRGLMLTVALANEPARAFYSAQGIDVSPVSPARCAPPELAATIHHEVRQRLWSAEAAATVEARGAAAQELLSEQARKQRAALCSASPLIG